MTRADWQAGYQRTYLDQVLALKQERHAQIKRRLYVDGKAYAVKHLTDRQIETLAWREAERACNEAINRGLGTR